MNTKEFVEAFYKEKQALLTDYLIDNPKSEVGQFIKTLHLTDQQTEILKRIMNGTLTDVFYTILMGLDGCASIGGIQELYQLYDENGNQLNGEIEGYAYEYFHKKD